MKILFASDLSFHYFEQFTSKDQAKRTFAEIAPEFQKADFSILNLENIFGERERYQPIIKSGPNLISDARFVEYVNALSPTIIGLANNHTKDYGSEAMFDTMDLLKKQGYQVIGAGKDIVEAYEGALIEKDSVKCRIIAVCENEFGTAKEDEPGTAGYNLSRVCNRIYEAKAKGELPIIYFHGGNEFNPFPSPGKIELYRHFVDAGAKAVIAMHTHCPQGYEMYHGCPIVYSMGNFFFPKNPEQVKASWLKGYMCELDIDAEQCKLRVIPYQFDFDEINMLADKEKEEFMKYLHFISGEIQNKDKIKEYFDAWSLMVGVLYMECLNFDTEALEAYTADDVKHIRNVFSCEAHNELVTNTINLVFEGRVQNAKKYMKDIERLQNLELVN